MPCGIRLRGDIYSRLRARLPQPLQNSWQINLSDKNVWAGLEFGLQPLNLQRHIANNLAFVADRHNGSVMKNDLKAARVARAQIEVSLLLTT